MELGFRRHGDINLHVITKEQYEALGKKAIKHDGSHIIARGEATNSTHILSVKDPQNLEIKEDALGRLLFAIRNEEATITHTHDHEVIKTPKDIFYVQIQEREVDHFADSVVRKVID